MQLPSHDCNVAIVCTNQLWQCSYCLHKSTVAISLQINAWFLENRDPETGEYPDFPDDTDAGSKIILNPPAAPPPPAPAADGKKGAKKASEKPKPKGKGKGKFVDTIRWTVKQKTDYCAACQHVTCKLPSS